MTDNPQLPGAPPLDDDAAWAPHQSAGGLVPDATPFTPRAVDPSAMTPAQRHAMREVIRSGDQAEYQRFLDGLNQQNAGGPAPGGSSAEPPAAEPEPEPEPEADAWTEVGLRLEEHGSSLEAITAIEPHMAEFAQRLEGLSDEDRHAALVAGDAEVLRAVYKGSDAAMAAGVAEIKRAAQLVGIDTESVDRLGILADPGLHLRVLGMARSVLSRAKS